MKNPILEEIRRIRLEIEAECQNDPDLLYEHLCQFQEKYRDRLVYRRPQPALILSSIPLPDLSSKQHHKQSIWHPHANDLYARHTNGDST